MKRIIFLLLTLLLAGVGGAKAAEVFVTKVTGTFIRDLGITISQGDILVIQGDQLEAVEDPLIPDDWKYLMWMSTSYSLRLENSTTVIPAGAFQSCFGLTGIECPDVTTIGDDAFKGCMNLVMIDCPEVTTIGNDAFNGCTALTGVSFPEVTEIGDNAFRGCRSLDEIINFPKVTEIGDNAFQSCSGLSSISMPEATTIGSYAFDGCTALASIACPSLITIGSQAFYSCAALTSIACPSLTTIGNYAFAACLSLTSITCPSLTTIGSYAFIGTPLTSITCQSLTTIGSYAFDGCTALTSITCPSLTSIDSYAFRGCAALTNINCPDLTTIGREAFDGCARLASIACPSLTTIGAYVFSGCSSLTLLELGSTPPSEVDGTSFGDISGPLLLLVPDTDGYTDAYMDEYPAGSVVYEGGWTETDTVKLDEGDELSLVVFGLEDRPGISGLQWKKGGADISGATRLSYTVASVTTADEGDYTMSFTFNEKPANLFSRQVTVNPAPEPEPEPEPEVTAFTVTLLADEGINLLPSAGMYTASMGNSFAFYITLAPGFEGHTPQATVNGNPVTLILRPNGYEWMYVIPRVDDDTRVNVTLSTTGNDRVDASRIYSREGQLVVETAQAGTLTVYNTSGQTVVNRRLTEGLTTIALPEGVYIVKLGERVERVVMK